MSSCAAMIVCFGPRTFRTKRHAPNLHDLVKEFFDRKDLPATAKNKIARANPTRFYAL
jgi:hypothetical protein